MNLGIVYKTKGSGKAIEYHERSLTIKEQVGDTLA